MTTVKIRMPTGKRSAKVWMPDAKRSYKRQLPTGEVCLESLVPENVRNDFTQWSAGAGQMITADQAMSPALVQDADEIDLGTQNGSSNRTRYDLQGIPTPYGRAMDVRMWLKPQQRDNTVLRMYNHDSNGAGEWRFNIQDLWDANNGEWVQVDENSSFIDPGSFIAMQSENDIDRFELSFRLLNDYAPGLKFYAWCYYAAVK